MTTKRKIATPIDDEIEVEKNGPSHDFMPLVLKEEDEIISYIKDKAVKETLKTLAPLLEKLEEAVKQQQSNNLPASSSTPNFDSAEQLKRMQEASKDRIKMQELKVAEKVRKLQARIAKRI